MRFDTSDVEEIADHVLQLCNVVESQGQVLVLLGSQITKYSIQYVSCEEIDCCERGTEFMRDMRKKPFLQARALLLGFFEYDRKFPPFGRILHDDRKALNRALTVPGQRCDVDIGPELLLGPPYAPSFIFRPACPQGRE